LVKDPTGNVTISDEDVRVEILRAPADLRQRLSSDPNKLKQIAANLFLARALTRQAEGAGFDKDSDIALQLQQAKERELGNAWLAKIEGELPDDASLEKAAIGKYKAFPEQFMTPPQIHASHILIKKDRENARVLADEILAKAKGGADFADLAKKYSDDPGSKENGGDLGFFPRKRMVKQFEDAAFDLKNPGDISEVFETQFGYHIVKLEGRKESELIPFEKIKEQIKRDILTDIRKERRGSVIEPIRANAVYDDSALEAFAAKNK